MIEKAILDHGYIALVETWGSDQRIIESARMSTNKGFLDWGPLCIDCGPQSTASVDTISNPENALKCAKCGAGGLLYKGDEKLLRYLHEHAHSTPFEVAGMTVEVQAPIFVFREWHRHRTQSYNEMSARYTPLPDVNYIPSIARLMMGGGHLTKQAGTIAGADALTVETAEAWRSRLAEMYSDQEAFYQDSLRLGVPKELARVDLPVGRYSRMRATANLRNWLGFLTLRMAKDAQWEIRQYANAVGELIAEQFPRTWSLFAEGRE